jgi:CheY-like chemotaxis protein
VAEETAPVHQVLVVEDDEQLLKVIQRKLKRPNRELHGALDGPSAIAAVRSGRRFDLIWCDLQLGGPIDGVAVLLEAVIRCPSATLCLVTAMADADRLRELPAGVRRFDKEQLSKAFDDVNELLDGR